MAVWYKSELIVICSSLNELNARWSLGTYTYSIRGFRIIYIKMMRGLNIFIAALIANVLVSVDSYETPITRVELLSPRGFRVSIPDAPGVELFAFHGNINRPLQGVDAGDFSADIYSQRNGRWTYRNPTASLNPGDTLYFWTMIHVDGIGHQTLYQRFYVPGDCPRVPDDIY